MLTKDDIIKQAFSEIGLGAYSYSLQPEDKQTALSRLDLLMAEWLADGIDIEYLEGGISGDSGLADANVRAVILNLAVEIAPNFGIQLSPNTIRGAVKAKAIVRRNTLTVPSRVTNTTAIPAGAGHKLRRRINLVQE